MPFKAGKPTRAQLAAANGADPWEYLLGCYKRERSGAKKREFAWQLLPYLKPKLRAIEHSGDLTINHTFTIGGPEDG